MDPIKAAFDKIKEDIFSLKQEIASLRQGLEELRAQKHQENQEKSQFLVPTKDIQNPTHQPSAGNIPAHIPANQHTPQALESSNFDISTGNRGVPTDKPTNQQTNQQTGTYPYFEPKKPVLEQNFANSLEKTEKPNNSIYSNITEFERISQILSSLDSIKKEIRLKFKRLTTQEMLVFSTLYSLIERGIDEITYKTLATHLNLTESSIRDYITKLANKGIPVIKLKQNNKIVFLSISKDLRKIASLSTIIKLREI